jgi:hypothetical protein
MLARGCSFGGSRLAAGLEKVAGEVDGVGNVKRGVVVGLAFFETHAIKLLCCGGGGRGCAAVYI